MRVYIKKGQKNYKESKLVNKLEKAIEKKIQEDANFSSTYKPATNFAELQKQYDTYCVEDVEFTEIRNTQESENHKEFRDSMQQTMEKETPQQPTSKITSEDKYEDNDSFIDPLNREEPIVRDYVTNNEFPDESKGTQNNFKTSFDEPLNFKDSFEMPGDETKQQSQNGTTKKESKPKSEPVNPNWDDMGNSKKKRSTRKFAKYIVETTCMLSEKGFVWFANKDINDSKLAEYELNNEMDLDLLVTLEDGQEATVKQFFQIQCLKAEQLAKIDPEEKSDLADALAEVLIEKGVGPTPTQELLLISLKIFGGQAAALFMLKSQTTGLLTQLRARKEEESGQSNAPKPQPKPEPTYEQQDEKESSQLEKEIFVEAPTKSSVKKAEQVLIEGDYTLLEHIDNTQETKE